MNNRQFYLQFCITKAYELLAQLQEIALEDKLKVENVSETEQFQKQKLNNFASLWYFYLKHFILQ